MDKHGEVKLGETLCDRCSMRAANMDKDGKVLCFNCFTHDCEKRAEDELRLKSIAPSLVDKH